VSYETETPFDSIESSHQYLSLLLETTHEARDAVVADLSPADDSRYNRRTAVLRLVSYNLEKLEKHVKISRRILNDLRTLRRLLLEERKTTALPTLPPRQVGTMPIPTSPS
jgi:hypothetical protein